MEKLTQTIILFDLDGTLTDSAEGIFRCAQYMQQKMGMRVWSTEELGFMIGPPLRDSFANEMNMTPEQVEQAIAFFRERYFSIGLFENKVYDGIVSLLETLQQKGKRLAVATSKHQSTAIRILEHFGLSKYFEIIGGDAPEGGRSNKSTVIAYVLQELHANLEDVIMVGDRKFDIEGAHENNIKAIGVLYGYGNTDEFIQCGADYIVQTPEELAALF